MTREEFFGLLGFGALTPRVYLFRILSQALFIAVVAFRPATWLLLLFAVQIALNAHRLYSLTTERS